MMHPRCSQLSVVVLISTLLCLGVPLANAATGAAASLAIPAVGAAVLTGTTTLCAGATSVTVGTPAVGLAAMSAEFSVSVRAISYGIDQLIDNKPVNGWEMAASGALFGLSAFMPHGGAVVG